MTASADTQYLDLMRHVLEHGHAKRTGGRVSARPHVKPVCDERLTEDRKSVV